jgi:transposase
MKQRALQLLQEGWEIDEIAGVLAVSGKSITRWKDNYEEYGDVAPPSCNRGCRRILNHEMLDDLQGLIAETPSTMLDELCEWLAIYHDQPIFTSALSQNLLDARYTYKMLRRAAAEQDNAACEAWMDTVLTRTTQPTSLSFWTNLAGMAVQSSAGTVDPSLGSELSKLCPWTGEPGTASCRP